MNIEKYTERSRGFIQSAQSLATREGHQQFSPLHLMKVLLDDNEGLAGAQRHRLEGFGGEALDGIAVEASDFGRGRRGHAVL